MRPLTVAWRGPGKSAEMRYLFALRDVVQPRISMLGCGPTTPPDYPEWSGFGRRREREWGSPAAAARGVMQENPLARIYIIGNDDMTFCREAPATITEGEVVVASKEELHAAPLSGKRRLGAG